MFHNPFKDFFYFIRSDRRAIFAIFCIAVFCAGVVCVVNSIDRDVDARKMENVEDAIKKVRLREGAAENGGRGGLASSAHATLHAFDPNDVDSLTLVSFGIRPYKVKNFLRYRAAGKIFFSPNDLGDTYGWTQEDVDLLAPYVVIDKRKVDHLYKVRNKHRSYENGRSGTKRDARRSFSDAYNSSNPGNSSNDDIASSQYARENKSDSERMYGKNNDGQMAGDASAHGGYVPKFNHLTVVDVNVVDSATLRRIPGVGEKTCKAILKYRERLGGLYDVEQLLEVKLVSSDLLKWFEVREGFKLTKIKLNSASFRVLNAHPYIRYEQAKDLTNYIRLYGSIKDERMLTSTGIFTVDEMKKLRPYIDYAN